MIEKLMAVLTYIVVVGGIVGGVLYALTFMFAMAWNYGLAPALKVSHIEMSTAFWIVIGLSVVGRFFRSEGKKGG